MHQRNKTSLSCFNEERYILDEDISTIATANKRRKYSLRCNVTPNIVKFPPNVIHITFVVANYIMGKIKSHYLNPFEDQIVDDSIQRLEYIEYQPRDSANMNRDGRLC